MTGPCPATRGLWSSGCLPEDAFGRAEDAVRTAAVLLSPIPQLLRNKQQFFDCGWSLLSHGAACDKSIISKLRMRFSFCRFPNFKFKMVCTWRASVSGDSDCKLWMVSGLRRCPLSSEALISSHEAGLFDSLWALFGNRDAKASKPANQIRDVTRYSRR